MTDPAVLLDVDRVTKSYAGIAVLREASFEVRRGEVLGLVGENGAGKSTALNVITGITAPDSGRVSLDGRTVTGWNPHQARAAGVGSVQQELSLNPHQTVAENVFLGGWPSRRGLVRRRELAARARPLLERVGLAVDPLVPVGELSLARRQLVELAKALAGDPSLLILDEATSALDDSQVEALFKVVRELRDGGRSVIIVSHRLDELFAVCDRLTVLKDGELVATRRRDETDQDDLVRLMIGRELAALFPAKSSGPPLGPGLRASGLTTTGAFENVDLDVPAGRIVGLGGLAGQGQREVLRALFGLRRHSGRIEIDGKACRIGGPGAAIRRGVAYVPEDRKLEGLHTAQSIRGNLTLPSVRALTPARRLFTVSRSAEERMAAGLVDRLRITARGLGQEARRLSGGNQQKVALARWLPTQPSVLLLNEPTRGIDVGTKREIYHLLRSLADAGLAVLVTSTDTMELVGLCDEVLVMYEGRVVRSLAGDEVTEQDLVHASVTGGAAHV
ncbi:sugar ABC transporter ATP-binding protein [Pseudonocardia acaciae]|uniref:sugar ABC transporter ATP-binding protein n=1 Tax=Pseudonocardia acaciae TaxID=551276 RepID=UPI0004906E33|nr:sugar ABC transporter ATP-binding protein [Pseudonocardia acaciae]